MKKMFYSFIRVFATIALFVCCVSLFLAGCASTETTQDISVVEQTQTKTKPKKNNKEKSKKSNVANLERRLINAERKERLLMSALDHAKTTDEIIRCKDELNKIHKEIADIENKKDKIAASENEGFKSVKERRYTYGPLGFVFKLTQWILEKLYVMDRS